MKTLTLAALISTVALCLAVQAQSSSPTRNEFPLFVKVQLDSSVKLSSLKAGQSVEGNLTRDVYLPENKVFVSGSHIHLTVSQLNANVKHQARNGHGSPRCFSPGQ